MTSERTIKVDILARVEGEGSLTLNIEKDIVKQAHLVIFEPPRFFEALLRGRHFSEVPDITARICGICPIAHQTSSIQAIEQALNITIDEQLQVLRRIFYCGEWIESHSLHIVMLHAPDFLGFPDAIQMAREYGDLVTSGLFLKKTGNEIMRIIGGREIHPINMKVGGFYHTPTRKDLNHVEENLKQGYDIAIKILKWVSNFQFPDFERDYEFVSLRHPNEYPIDKGEIISSKGINITALEFENEFEERHVEHSNALQSVIKQRGSYHVGPLARYTLNFDRLPEDLQSLTKEIGLGPTCQNPFKSIMIRAIELIYACGEALRLIANYQQPKNPAVQVNPKAGQGSGVSEAPRGMLYHFYHLADDGSVIKARIVPPTSQNQLSIEEDLLEIAQQGLILSNDELQHKCELAIRNYDPCISCATHFLKLSVNRS